MYKGLARMWRNKPSENTLTAEVGTGPALWPHNPMCRCIPDPLSPEYAAQKSGPVGHGD